MVIGNQGLELVAKRPSIKYKMRPTVIGNPHPSKELVIEFDHLARKI
jgi:hypothetical protein